MAAWTLAAGLLLTAALLAGCAGDSPPPATAPDPEPPAAEAPAPLRAENAFGWVAGAGAPVLPGGPQVGSTNAVSLELPQNGTKLRVYANWTCATITCDLHLYVYAPGEGPGDNGLQSIDSSGHAMGGSPLAVELEMPMAGEWSAALYPADPDAQVAGTLAIVADGVGAAAEEPAAA